MISDYRQAPAEPPTGPVTRSEVVDAIALAFDAPQASTADLITAALRSSARPEVVDLLHGLPSREFTRPHDLWTHLPEIPLE